LLVAVVMISSVFSLNVAAEGIADDMVQPRLVGPNYFEYMFDGAWATGRAYANADDSYAYAAIITCRPVDMRVHAYISNDVDSKTVERGDWGVLNQSLEGDVTLGELQYANDYYVVYSEGMASTGEYTRAFEFYRY